MTDLQTAAQQALEALKYFRDTAICSADTDTANEVIPALEAALAQQAERVEPVQQPYCYVYEYDGAFGLHREFYPKVYNGHKPDRTVPVYTAPPQRLPLTEGVLMGVYIDFDRTADPAWSRAEYLLRLFRAVERAHGIKE